VGFIDSPKVEHDAPKFSELMKSKNVRDSSDNNDNINMNDLMGSDDSSLDSQGERKPAIVKILMSKNSGILSNK
jgi:hypothetical protein